VSESADRGWVAVELPVMFGDGRTRRIGYASIRGTHSPNLVLTEVGPVKRHLLDAAHYRRERDEPLDEDKLRSMVTLVDQLVLEAAEALAYYGYSWPAAGAPRPASEIVVQSYEWIYRLRGQGRIREWMLLKGGDMAAAVASVGTEDEVAAREALRDGRQLQYLLLRYAKDMERAGKLDAAARLRAARRAIGVSIRRARRRLAAGADRA
jgi:hypothetical protein